MFSVIMFDLSGVLTKNPQVFNNLKEASRYKGSARSLQADIYADYIKLTIGAEKENDFWKKLRELSRTRRTAASIKKNFLNKFTPVVDKHSFRELRKYFKVALCTNFVASWWKELKRKLGIDFDYLLFSSEAGMRKPLKQFYLKAADNFKMPAGECVYVGDDSENLMGAKQAGMNTVLISENLKKHEFADYVYPNVNDFIKAMI